jgi:hypothetical protein
MLHPRNGPFPAPCCLEPPECQSYYVQVAVLMLKAEFCGAEQRHLAELALRSASWHYAGIGKMPAFAKRCNAYALMPGRSPVQYCVDTSNSN